jgi:hypothetical protein
MYTVNRVIDRTTFLELLSHDAAIWVHKAFYPLDERYTRVNRAVVCFNRSKRA